MSDSIYARHFGPAFDVLPHEVRCFHQLAGTHRLQGRVTVCGPEHFIGKCLAAIFRFPSTCTDAPLAFELTALPNGETWVRMFPGKRMVSRLSNSGDYLVEDFGPVRLWFKLDASATQLVMNLRRLTVLGIPVPAWLRPKVRAVETASFGQIHFDVAAWWPRDRLMVAYNGHLMVPPPAHSEAE